METKHTLVIYQVGGYIVTICGQNYTSQEEFTAAMLAQGVVDMKGKCC